MDPNTITSLSAGQVEQVPVVQWIEQETPKL